MTPVHGFAPSTALYAALKSVTTELATGAVIVPVIVHPVFVIELKVEPTFPLMAVPGPVSVQVTVPTVGMAFVPRTVKLAAVPRFGATWANAGTDTASSAANPRPASR